MTDERITEEGTSNDVSTAASNESQDCKTLDGSIIMSPSGKNVTNDIIADVTTAPGTSPLSTKTKAETTSIETGSDESATDIDDKEYQIVDEVGVSLPNENPASAPEPRFYDDIKFSVSSGAAQEAFLNRFSSWRKSAVTTLQQTASSISNSEIISTRVAWNGSIIVPLQTASLSPSITPKAGTNIVNSSGSSVVCDDHSNPIAEITNTQINESNQKLNTPAVENISVIPSSSTDPWSDLKQAEKNQNITNSFSIPGKSRVGTSVLPPMDTLTLAAASLVDSVQTSYFKGRYATSIQSGSRSSQPGEGNDFDSTGGGADDSNTRRPRSNSISSSVTNTTSTTNHSETQTSRILSGPSGVHIRDIVQSLQPNEVMMLLGKGRLGVNLKQSYKKNSGVYVDFVVAGGAAHAAGVASIGDTLKQVGSESQLQGSILSVPHQIATANRPVYLIFRSGTTDPCHVSKINYIDVSIALMHELLQQNTDMEQLIESAPCIGKTIEKEFPSTGICDSLDAITYPTSPPLPIQEEYAIASATRNLICGTGYTVKNNHLSEKHQSNTHSSTVKEICQLSASHPGTFRISLRAAYILCCMDCRRTPFLRSYLAGTATPTVVKDAHANFIYTGNTWNNTNESISKEDNTATKENASYLMMFELFMESTEFVEFYELMSDARRHANALRIAYKYLLPTTTILQNGLQTLTPPPMDLHSVLVSDSAMRKLERTLFLSGGQSALEIKSKCTVPRDVFLAFQESCLDQIACGPAFAGFLISAECSRMRAYLRNTAPFVNVPLDEVINCICDSNGINIHAQNYMQYCILFLICLTDKEVFGENDEILDQNKKSVNSSRTTPSPNKVYTAKTNSSLGQTPQPLSNRIEDVANGLCAALYIRGKLLPAVEQAKQVFARDNAVKSEETYKKILLRLIELFEQFWEVYVAPNVGALATAIAESSSNEEDILEKLNNCRNVLQKVAHDVLQKRNKSPEGENPYYVVACKLLVENSVVDACRELADELVYDYAVNLHSKFRMHKFHEWICEEFLIAKQYDGSKVKTMTSKIPPLPHGCIKRLLRKTDFPVGLSQHKPSHELQFDQPIQSDDCVINNTKVDSTIVDITAECAVVFGSSFGLRENDLPCPGLVQNYSDVRRFCCHDIAIIEDNDSEIQTSLYLQPQDIPLTLESYAVAPPGRNKPFSPFTTNALTADSADGWKVSLINFMIPRAENSSAKSGFSSLYGVTLMFQRTRSAHSSIDGFSPTSNEMMTELCVDQCSDVSKVVSFVESSTQDEQNQTKFVRQVRVAKECPRFNQQLANSHWSDQSLDGAGLDPTASTTVVGIALVSQRNTFFAMRSALSLLLHDFSKLPQMHKEGNNYGALANILGCFSDEAVECHTLKCILTPYLRQASRIWIEKPISAQHEAYVQYAGVQLIRSLPPIPLALMFVASLLEQKIVISSSRRSLLLCATTALTELLKPLNWCHVLVPQVPAKLAADLLQYPGPSILGLCSDDPGVIDLLRDLNHDVTLVDLDVGRVILASSFAHDSELGRGTPNNADTARALRSQVLYLAQSLGCVFGSHVEPQTWGADLPDDVSGGNVDSTQLVCLSCHEQFERLRSTCRDFVVELLAGTTSCCYWIEEAVSDEYNAPGATKDPTVLFDEDRFFHIKNFRERDGDFERLFTDIDVRNSNSVCSRNLALSLDNFDLVLELFLRCQSMNAYIGGRQRHEMVFSV